MSYRLAFLPSALKEFKQLDNSVREQFKKKLSELLDNPNIPANRLSGFQNHYKVKLKASGYRLVYEVEDDKVRVLVIAVGKRDKGRIYSKARKRT
jgi:mRNA interferase RelE/StbE